jgi:hypothetical protein
MEYIGDARDAIALTGGSTDPALFSNPVIIGYTDDGRPIYQASHPEGGGVPLAPILGGLPEVIAAANAIALGWYRATHQPEPEPAPVSPAPLFGQTIGLETVLLLAALVAAVWIASK